MDDVENEIINLIELIAEPESINRLDPVDELRQNIVANLIIQAEEIENFPELEGEPFCALIAADYDSQKQAMFILVLFDEDNVTIATGLGEFSEVLDFSDDFPEDESQVINQAQKRFKVSPTRQFNRARFESWLHS